MKRSRHPTWYACIDTYRMRLPPKTEHIHLAHQSAQVARLVADGMSPERAEAGVAAWEVYADAEGRERGRLAYWDDAEAGILAPRRASGSVPRDIAVGEEVVPAPVEDVEVRHARSLASSSKWSAARSSHIAAAAVLPALVFGNVDPTNTVVPSTSMA